MWVDYWVVDPDKDFQRAVVDGPSRKYPRVLSRCPGMDRVVFGKIRGHARKRGHPVEHLIMTGPLR